MKKRFMFFILFLIFFMIMMWLIISLGCVGIIKTHTEKERDRYLDSIKVEILDSIKNNDNYNKDVIYFNDSIYITNKVKKEGCRTI